MPASIFFARTFIAKVMRTTHQSINSTVSLFYGIPSVFRLGTFILIGLGSAHYANVFSHYVYYNRTLFRVQTVNLNMYANILPKSVKDSLESKQPEQAMPALQSNYGLLGIVVTKCAVPMRGKFCQSERLFATNVFAVQDNGEKVAIEMLPQAKTSTTRTWAKDFADLSSDRSALFTHLKSSGHILKQGVYRDSDDPDFSYEKPASETPDFSTANASRTLIGNIYLIRNRGSSADEEIRKSLVDLAEDSWAGLQSLLPGSNSRSKSIVDFVSESNSTYPITYIFSLLVSLLLWLIVELIRKQGILQIQRKQEQTTLKLLMDQSELDQKQRQLAVSQREQAQQQLRLTEAERRQAREQLDYFRIRYSAEAFSNELQRDFTTRLNSISQKILFLMNELANEIRQNTRNILHDIGHAPLMKVTSTESSDVPDLIQELVTSDALASSRATPIDNLGQLEDFTRQLLSSKNEKEQRAGSILFKVKHTYEQLQFVARDLREAADTTKHCISIREIERRIQQQPNAVDAKGNQLIHIKACEPECFVWGNRWQIFSIVRNILYNSKKAAERKANRLRRMDPQSNFIPLVEVSTEALNGHVTITIKDNGPGVKDPELLRTLYQWSGKEVSQKDLDKLSGNGSDIVANYLLINESKAVVKNNDPDESTGLTVQIQFAQATTPSSAVR